MHPTWSEDNILEVLHFDLLDQQFYHMQRHVNMFHTHIHQRPLYIMEACQNCVMMDAMTRNQLGGQNARISVSITVFGKHASWVLNANSTRVSSVKSWLRDSKSFS